MASIGEIVFWKAFVLTGWTAFQEAREAELDKRAWRALVARFKREWDRRRAEQPLQLTYRPLGSGATESAGTIEQ